jgi:hypothetical protein
MRAVEARAKTPRARLLAAFDALAEWFEGRDFSGCMFINASAEFAEANYPIHGAAAEHKGLILGYLGEQAEAAGAEDASTLAMELMLLMEGAIVMAYVAGEADAAGRAKAAARTLLKGAGL